MTKPEIAAIALSAVACAAGVFATVAAQRSADSLAAFEQKLAKLEKPAATTGTAAPAGPSNSDLARELNSVRSQLAGLSSRSAAVPVNPNEKPPAPFQPVGPIPAAAKEDAEKRRLALKEGMTKGIMTALTDKVGLTDQQGAQIREVVAKQIDEWQDLRRSAKPDEMKQAAETFLTDTNGKIKVFLTPEQQSKYDAATKGTNGVFGMIPAGVNAGPARPEKER